MNQNFTRIAIILDRSGSMRTLVNATVSGFNEYVGKLKSQPGEVKLKLIRFDDQYEEVFDKPLSEVPLLTADDMVPRGMTALLDAQGKTIVNIGRELEGMTEEDRPAKVIVMTMTDGEENQSREYDTAQIASMIKAQQEKYGWEFLYFGANQDALKVAATMNIPQRLTMTYAANAGSTQSVMSSAAMYTNSARGMTAQGQSTRSLSFSDDQRKTAQSSDKPDEPKDQTIEEKLKNLVGTKK